MVQLLFGDLGILYAIAVKCFICCQSLRLLFETQTYKEYDYQLKFNEG